MLALVVLVPHAKKQYRQETTMHHSGVRAWCLFNIQNLIYLQCSSLTVTKLNQVFTGHNLRENNFGSHTQYHQIDIP